MNLLTTIYVLDVVILLNRTPIIEWYVITCGFKANTYICAKRDWTTCSIVVPIIELILNIIGGKGGREIWPSNEHNNFDFVYESNILMSFKN